MKFFLLITLISLSSIQSARAEQAGKLVCVKFADESGSAKPCEIYELRIKITPDEDIGLPGAFWINIQDEDMQIMSWTPAKGFQLHKDVSLSLAEPAEWASALPAVRDYVVFRGSQSELCRLRNGRNFKVLAGHGTFMSKGQQEMNTLVANNRPADEIERRKRYWIAFDMVLNPRKGGMAYNHKCHSDEN